MKTDVYTKIILTALTIGVFALVYQQSDADGLSPISVAEAKGNLSVEKVYNWVYQAIEIQNIKYSRLHKNHYTFLSASDCLHYAKGQKDLFCVRVQPTEMRFKHGSLEF